MKGRKKKQTTPTAIVRGFTSASLTELLLITAAGSAGDATDLKWLSSFCSPIKAGLETKR